MTMSKALHKLLDEVERVTDFDARFYRKSTLIRRVDSRIRETRSVTCRNYLSYLKNNPSEYERFLEALTINVTDFFRDKSVFHNLKRNILPDIIRNIKDKKRKVMRIWSIGCSRGQEPYSMAILLKEISEKNKNNVQIFIRATDMNRAALRKAKLAIYNEEEVKSVPTQFLKKYFEKVHDAYRVRKELRELVRFNRHDLIKGNSLGKFHLILCRNLFIFFEPQLQEKILKKIHTSLKRNGILVLGKAETLKDDSLFRCIAAQNRIYRKKAPS
jgi:chemotaxis protein methyltransferase CheR